MSDRPDEFPRLFSVRTDRERATLEPRSEDLEENSSSPHLHPINENATDRGFSSVLQAMQGLSPDERGVLATLLVQRRAYGQNTELVQAGQTPARVFILQEGWACTSRSLSSYTRPLSTVYVPGDLIGYPAALSGRDDGQSVVTATEAIASEVSVDRLHHAFEIAPSLSRKMMWNPGCATAIPEERRVGLGRRTARARTAYFFLALLVRLDRGAKTRSLKFPCPLSPFVVADSIGLMAEHLNRILNELRTEHLLRVGNCCVEIVDLEGLIRLADFDGEYLSSEL